MSTEAIPLWAAGGLAPRQFTGASEKQAPAQLAERIAQWSPTQEVYRQVKARLKAHRNFDLRLLRDLLHAHRGGFLLSCNDCAVVRDWYRDFRILEVAWQYTMSQDEARIGKNRIGNGSHNHVKQSHEQLIMKKGK